MEGGITAQNAVPTSAVANEHVCLKHQYSFVIVLGTDTETFKDVIDPMRIFLRLILYRLVESIPLGFWFHSTSVSCFP